MLFEGVAQRFLQRVVGPAVASLTGLGSLRVAQVEGDGDECTRAGLRFFCSAQGATGIAPVQSNVSTAAQWLFYNPAGSPVVAFFDTLGVTLASGTAGAGGSLHYVAVGPSFVPTTVPTVSTANVLLKNANPLSSRASKLICASAATLVNAAASDWAPIAQMNPTGTVLGQTQIVTNDIKGKIIVPPGCGLGLAVISPTGTTPLWTPIACWREYAADLE